MIICWTRPTSWPTLLGQPVVANGIALSKIHHAAFDNHLMGIDPDGRVHVSKRLLMLHEGPLLEQSLKAAAVALIRLPRAKQYYPHRDRLPFDSSSSGELPR
jgi:putative restriction endonuclease